MIVTIANPKGGTGKTTLVRALSGTAAHAGNDVFLIDADSRANTMRWVTMSKQMDVWPDRLEAESCLDPNQASRHESGESVRLLRTYPEFRLV